MVELRHRELVGLDEQGRATSGRSAIVSPAPLRAGKPAPPLLGGSVEPTPLRLAADDDETGIARRVLGRGLLVESGRRATDVVAEARARGVEDEEPRRLVARHLESVDDLGRDERPGLGADPMLAIFEPERELALEDEQRLGMSCMDVERRFSPTGSGAYVRPHRVARRPRGA